MRGLRGRALQIARVAAESGSTLLANALKGTLGIDKLRQLPMDVRGDVPMSARPVRAARGEDRAGLVIQRRVKQAAQLWAGQQRDDSLLFRGAQLAQATQWRKTWESRLGELERSFLDASEALKTKRDPAAARPARLYGSLLLIIGQVVLYVMVFAFMKRSGATASTVVKIGVGFLGSAVVALLFFRRTLMANSFHRGLVLLGITCVAQVVAVRCVSWRLGLQLPAMLAVPMAKDIGVSTPTVFAALSTRSRVMNFPISTVPTSATAFCTRSRSCGVNRSNWSGIKPNSALIFGIIRDSSAASTAQSSPGTGTAPAAAATNARRCRILRPRCTASVNAGCPRAKSIAEGMGGGNQVDLPLIRP